MELEVKHNLITVVQGFVRQHFDFPPIPHDWVKFEMGEKLKLISVKTGNKQLQIS